METVYTSNWAIAHYVALKLPTTELEILGESLLDFSQLQDLIDWLGVH